MDFIGQTRGMSLQTVKKPLGGVGGATPSDCNPKPVTCAVASEALRSKVSLHPSPALSMAHR